MATQQIKQRKPRTKKQADEDIENPEEPFNGKELVEVEHYNLQKLLYIYKNWNNLGDKVGKAYINGEIVENEAFKTVVEKLILDCKTDINKYPYCDRTVYYSQNKTLKSGRYMAKNFGIINMARPVRHTICDGLYQDLDVVNCHLYIYRYLCEINDLECVNIDEYIDNRDIHIQECIQLNEGSKRDDAKQWFLKVLNGGGKETQQIKKLTPFMENYNNELQILHSKLSTIIEQQHPEFRKYIIDRDGNNLYNLECKIVSKKLEDLENRMRYYICEFVKSKKCDFSSHCYDGGMSYIINNPAPIKTIIKIDASRPDKNECSRYVLQKTGITCPLKWKDFDEQIAIPQEELNKITIEDYNIIKNSVGKSYKAVKLRFEKNNFFINNTVKYCYEYEPENIVLEYSRDSFISKYEDLTFEEETQAENGETNITQQSFINRWVKDPTKRRYDKVVWIPESIKQKSNLPSSVYNLWKGFQAEHIKPDGNDYSHGVNLILNHLKYLVNNNEIYYNYFLKWNARLYQYPARKTEVCIGLKSFIQGAGKTTMFDLHTAIMGKQYTAKLENPERDMYGEFNELMYKRIFILLEECDYSVMTKFNKRFLDTITCKVDNINIKNGGKMDVDSFTNYMAVWNTSGLKVSKEDRRVWANEICVNKAPSKEYFDNLFGAINNPQVQRAFYDYLMNVKLESHVNDKGIEIPEYHPSRDRPYTDLREKMEQDSRDKIEYFIKDLTVDWWRYKTGLDDHEPVYNYLKDPKLENQTRISCEVSHRSDDIKGWLTSEYLIHFKNWIKSKGFIYNVDEISFSKRIKASGNDGLTLYTSSGKSKIKFNISKSLEWCKKQKLITEEDLQEEL